MHENNDHLLAGAWWVTLKSPDFFKVFLLDLLLFGPNVPKFESLFRSWLQRG